MNRRSFLGGLLAAPAIVAVGNIMPVRSSKLIATPTIIEVKWRQGGRACGRVRVTNPDDPTQWIEVERLESILMPASEPEMLMVLQPSFVDEDFLREIATGERRV